MTKGNNLLLLVSLTLIISLIGFSSGCGGSSSNNTSLSGSHISISNLSPTEIIFLHDPGTTTITLTFNATDFS